MKLDKFVQVDIARSIISCIERGKLLAAAEAMESQGRLMKAYRKSVPEHWDTPNFFDELPNILAAMLKNLAKIPLKNESVPPVLEFVERLSLYALHQEQKTVSDKLHSWVQYKGVALKLSLSAR